MVDPFIFSLDRMKYLVDKLEQESNFSLAIELCKTSRYLHMDVWANLFTEKSVETDVLPCMYRASNVYDKINSEQTNKPKSKFICSFKKNNDDRIQNIVDNYLKGNSSSFMPDEKLRDLASAGEKLVI